MTPSEPEERASSVPMCMAVGALAATEALALYDSALTHRWAPAAVHAAGLLAAALLWRARAVRPRLSHPRLLPLALLLHLAAHVAVAALLLFTTTTTITASALLPFAPSVAPALALLLAAGAGPRWGPWERGAVCALGAVAHAAALAAVLTAAHWGAPGAAALLAPAAGAVLLAGAALVLRVVETPGSRSGAVAPWAAGAAALLAMLPVGALPPAAAAGVLAPLVLAGDTLLRAGAAGKDTAAKVVAVSGDARGSGHTVVARVTKHRRSTPKAAPTKHT